MVVELYLFSKRENSTKIPQLGSGTNYDMDLKDDTSIMNPVLTIAVSSMPLPTVAPIRIYNYAYIAKFGRYYFITDWRYTGNIWECSLMVDVLGSFKNDIGDTRAYVERAASAYDGDVIDSLYPARTNFSVQRSAISYAYNNVAPSGGCYVVGIINYQSSNHVGAVAYYALTTANLNALLAYLFGNNIYTSSAITEIGEGLFKSLFNPFQYIVSCMWFPYSTDTFGNTATDIKVGYYSSGVNGIMVSSLAHKGYASGTIPNHPQASTRGNYLNFAPYTKVTVYIPPFGSIPIDTWILSNGHYLHCPIWVDHITGQATIHISTSANASQLSENNVCATRTANIGVPIQLAQVLSDYSHTINSIGNTVQAGTLAGVVGGLIATTVSSALDASFPSVSTSGANGSFLEVLETAHIITEFAQITQGDNTEFGRPLMQVKTINTLSGYIKCLDADVEYFCMENERSRIKNYLLSGFFYE